MLRANLSSRPFYNERAVSAVIIVLAAVSIGVAVFAVQRVLSLSAQRTTLREQIGRDQATIERADQESAALQKAINTRLLRGLALNTQQANKLIDARTFSWTTFFKLIERTLPNDVRIQSVSPTVDKQGVLVLMRAVSKKPEDLAAFIDALQQTGSFYDILPQQEDSNDDGTRVTSLAARYLPPKEAK